MKISFLFIIIVFSSCAYAQEYIDSLITIPIEKYYELLSAADTTISKLKLNELVEKSTSDQDSLWIGIIGGVAIQKIIGQPEEEIPTNLSIGIVYKQLFKNDRDLKLFSDIYTQTYINLSQSYDTLNAGYFYDAFSSNATQFGNFLLLPINSRYSASSYFTAYFYENPDRLNNSRVRFDDVFFGIFNGIHGETAGQNVFTSDSVNINIVGLLIRIGLFHEFIPRDIRLHKNYSIIIGLDFSQRYVFGDFGQNVNGEFRKSNHRAEKITLLGTELFLNFRLENLFIEATVPNLWCRENEDIAGIKLTRFLIKVKFVGSLPLAIK